MKLYAISDVHVRHKLNKAFLEQLPAHPGDWLILAGDVGETGAQLSWTLDTLCPRWKQLIWVPGNHELWSGAKEPRKGVEKYEQLVQICRSRGVLTPEDPFPTWDGDGEPVVVAPLLLLYDYSFAPASCETKAQALAWAAEDKLHCTDEYYLKPKPYPNIEAWCEARVRETAARLDTLPADRRTVLINHFPLLPGLCRLPRIPRFRIWCGTRRVERWHTRYRAKVVVSGHLHMPATDWRDGVRFEEVSLGYPRQWKGGMASTDPGSKLREILPGGPLEPPSGFANPIWYR